MVNRTAQLDATPRKSVVALVVFYLLVFAGWLFLLGGFNSLDWLLFLASAVVAAAFASFGVSLFFALRLLLGPLPLWLSRRHAAYLVVGGLLLQSALVGALTFFGAWPHKDLWFLGVIPFLWRG